MKNEIVTSVNINLDKLIELLSLATTQTKQLQETLKQIDSFNLSPCVDLQYHRQP